MSGRFVLPLFFAAIFFGAMVLGPLLFFALELWHVPFHRAMDRALLISALVALGFFTRRMEWRQLWPWTTDGGWQALLGLCIAAVSLQAIIGFDLAAAGFHSAGRSAGQVMARVAVALVAALLVAPAEETVFRGFLQRELSRWLGWRAGWLLGAIVFALAHFLKIPVSLDQQPVHWTSGAGALGAAFVQLGHDLHSPENLAKATNLLLIGLILGGVYLRSGALWIGTGLHAGWIFALLLFTGLTRLDEPPRYAAFGGDILSSLVTTLVLVVLGLWLWRYYRHPSVQPEPA